ncbi:hypothetical protein Peur_004639 [Populus x canadensis]
MLLVYFAGDWEMHRRYGREEKKETIPIYQLAGLHRRPHALPLFPRPENFLDTVPTVEGYPCNFRLF